MNEENFEIFQEFCNAKTNLATEVNNSINQFLLDNILHNLDIFIPFETKYQNIKKYLIDFMVISDNLLSFAIKFFNNSPNDQLDFDTVIYNY